MSQIQHIKEVINIIDVIGSRVELRRAGSNFKGLCPFHSEKSPSFSVNEQMQRYKCFGCGESGDVFTFLERYEGMTFYEALSYLADQAGIKLEEHRPDPQEKARELVLEVLQLASEYYHYILTSHQAGASGREYLKKRGVIAESIKLFKLGYALPSWDALYTYLHRKKKYPEAVLLQAGLLVKGKNGVYDRFRDRLIYSLRDHRGRIVGFSGRLLTPDARSAKYINSPETLVYHKTKMLYGYHELYQGIRQANEIIVTEGEMDVISASQLHINNIVAIKGSALTTDHAKLLSRTVSRVLLALDSDNAGVVATKKAITTLREYPLELRVIPIPHGKDLDDLAHSNPVLLRQLVQASVTAYEFLIQHALSTHDPVTASGKRDILTEVAPIVATVPHEVEKEHYISLLATALGVQPAVVRADVEHATTFGKRVAPLLRSARDVPSAPLSARRSAEQYVLHLLLQDETSLLKHTAQLQALELIDPVVRQVVQMITERGVTSVQALTKYLPEDIVDEVFSIYAHPAWSSKSQDTSARSQLWDEAMTILEHKAIQDKKHSISQELRTLSVAEHKTTQAQHREATLMKQLAELNALLHKKGG